jgi:ABC-type multidrug transport system ATPase subunit
LTVRENFIFAGRFQLPKGTPKKEIADLADATMANLGLSRVMHSVVGDVTRRGVSGGEKKRVNIGLELMARPKILFLDEPTSGLDANSALMVMESLKTLAQVYGTTICSVIHQPRKFIFELFDSLILLGVGGKMVYHGPVSGVETYFTNLHYVLPAGESIADWLIDISSGRLGPSSTMNDQSVQDKPDSQRCSPFQDGITEEMASEQEDDTTTSVDVDKVENMLRNSARMASSERLEGPVLEDALATSSSPSPMHTSTISFMDLDKSKSLNNADIFEDPTAQSKARLEVLYSKWMSYMAQLSEEERDIYEASEPYDLPEKTEKASFCAQFWFQMLRMGIVGQRNWVTKVIDTSIIVLAAVLVSVLDGPEEITFGGGMGGLTYDAITEPGSVSQLLQEYPKLFGFAIGANMVNLMG